MALAIVFTTLSINESLIEKVKQLPLRDKILFVLQNSAVMPPEISINVLTAANAFAKNGM